MEFGFKNFGMAGSGSLGINDLTVICGPNNTGKTYLSYAIYSLLKNLEYLIDFGVSNEIATKVMDELKSKGEANADLSVALLRLAKLKSNPVRIIGPDIHLFFQVPEKYFQNSEISLKLDEIDIDSTITKRGHILDNSINYRYQCDGERCELRLSLENSQRDSNFVSSYLNDKANIGEFKGMLNGLLYDAHLSDIVPKPFAITSERSGIALFYKIFDFDNNRKLKLINSIGKVLTSSNLVEMRSSQALPIEDNINNVRFYEDLTRRKSFILKNKKHHCILEKLSDLLDDGYFESLEGSYYFHPKKDITNSVHTIPLHVTSSSVKSLFLFDLFIKNIAQQNSLLIIDEPELNLSIEKQVEMARLIARLANAGIKVLATTHSDIFVREINNLLTMNGSKQETKKKIMKKYDIHQRDLLQFSQVNAYGTSEKFEINEIESNNTGVNPVHWNNAIANENMKSEEIYYSIGVS